MPKVWCACPIRCKGGREVAHRTRARHEREIRVKERQQIVQLCYPDRVVLAPKRRRRTNNNNPQGSCSKRARGNDRQEGEGQVQSVGASTFLPAKINVMTSRLFKTTINSKLRTRQMVMDVVGPMCLRIYIFY